MIQPLIDMIKVKEFFELHKIEYVLHEHPAVYTCEEAERHCSDIPGLACKNLFLRDGKRKRYFLAILPAQKKTDLKKLCGIAGVKKLAFANTESLRDKLGLEAGSVSPFGLLNDITGEVELYVDKDVYAAETVVFHPNVNTASLELSRRMFRKFLQIIDHEVNIVEL